MRFIELFEGRESPLYHGTDLFAAMEIINKNEILNRTYMCQKKLW
jgi:hypothetical protein